MDSKPLAQELAGRPLSDVAFVVREGATLGGEDHAPELIDDLVDSYEVETQGFLQKEAENVHKLIKAARDSANSGEAAVKPYVDKLDAVARNWDKVAQPIQLSAKARGIDHEASSDLAYEIRSLAIDLFCTHDMLTQSQRLIGLLQELFAELPEVSERVEQVADALADIFHKRKQAVARIDELVREFTSVMEDERAREITYRAEIGDVQGHSEHFARWNLMERTEFFSGLDHSSSLGWCAPLCQRRADGDDLHHCLRRQTLRGGCRAKKRGHLQQVHRQALASRVWPLAA